MQQPKRRLIVFIADIEIIMGCSNRTAQRHMKKAKETCGINSHQKLSITAFSQYSGLSEEAIDKVINPY